MEKTVNPDKINLKHEKGVWMKFIKMCLKSRLPWIWILLYLIVDIGVINIGISETELTAELFAGNVSSQLVTSLIIVIIINTLGSSVSVMIHQLTEARFNRNARQVAVEKVMKLPMSFFNEDNPREAILRIVTNTKAVGNTFVLFILPGITGLYSLFAVVRKIYYYDIRLTLILIVFIPIVLFISYLSGRINYSLNNTDKKIMSILTEQLSELVINIPLAKAFAKEKYEEKRGGELSDRYYKLNIKSSWLGQVFDMSFSLLDLIQNLCIIFAGLFLLKNEQIEMKSWIAFFLFSGVFTTKITELRMVWNNVKTIQGGAERMAEILDAPNEENLGTNTNNFNGSIEVKDLSFGYVENKPVLKGINCTFEKGKATALIGVSGCGKSTLVNLINRIYKPECGEISIDGINIQDYELNHFRKQFSFISQDIMLFSGTIRENLCYGQTRTYSDEELFEVLKKVHAYDFVMKLENKLDEKLSEYGDNLSGGQRQRLALARVLLDDAPYMILDEAFANMDAISTMEVLDVLKENVKDKTMIVIAHSSKILELVSDVIVIENGVVSACGSIEEVKNTSQFMKDFMRVGE